MYEACAVAKIAGFVSLDSLRKVKSTQRFSAWVILSVYVSFNLPWKIRKMHLSELLLSEDEHIQVQLLNYNLCKQWVIFVL